MKKTVKDEKDSREVNASNNSNTGTLDNICRKISGCDGQEHKKENKYMYIESIKTRMHQKLSSLMMKVKDNFDPQLCFQLKTTEIQYSQC